MRDGEAGAPAARHSRLSLRAEFLKRGLRVMENIWLAIISLAGTALTVTVTPFALAYLNTKAQERATAAANARADFLAERAKNDAREIAAESAAAANARQDEVARKAAATAEIIVSKADEATALLRENVAVVGKATAEAADRQEAKATAHAGEVKTQLFSIHTLVNSSLTEALQGRLAALEGKREVLTELVDMKKSSGGEPAADTLTKIAATEAEIAVLQAQLAERAKAARIVETHEKVAAATVGVQPS